jgi:hypothetical protein
MSDVNEVKPENIAEKIRLIQAALEFEKSLKQRSFFGRHPEIGKMIKCVKCVRRHREFDEQSCGTFNLVKEAEGQRAHPAGNPFWRSHPGKYVWIRDLKQFVTIQG